MGLYNLGEIPFHDVYIHPKILGRLRRDDVEVEGERRRSARHHRQIRGRCAALRSGLHGHRNAGRADAGRVRMPALPEAGRANAEEPHAAAGRMPALQTSRSRTQWAAKPEDIALPRAAVVSERFELARNFCNKLWNASRFALLNLEGYSGPAAGGQRPAELAVEDQWILSRLIDRHRAVHRGAGAIQIRRRRAAAVRLCLG